MSPTMAPAWGERRQTAMGSRLHVIATGADSSDGAGDLDRILEHAVDLVGQLERRWSRFQPDSEVSHLNASAGRPVAVSALTLELVVRAVEARRRTDGSFDPTMLRHVQRAGYDRTFTLIEGRVVPGWIGDEAIDGARGIEIDVDASTVQLPPGVGFDPGGLGKGLAADLVSASMIEAGASGALVNIGGDLRCRGIGTTGAGWAIQAGDAVAGVASSVIDLAAGGIATSTSRRRRWSTDTGPAHHLIDPSTGRSAGAAADVVTVIAASACDAETLATALAVLGDSSPPPSMMGEAAAIVDTVRGRRTIGPIERYLR